MNATRKSPLKSTFAVMLVILSSIAATVMAAPPDLTSGGAIPGSLTTTWNLGPTGMRGWVYYDTEKCRNSHTALYPRRGDGESVDYFQFFGTPVFSIF